MWIQPEKTWCGQREGGRGGGGGGGSCLEESWANSGRNMSQTLAETRKERHKQKVLVKFPQTMTIKQPAAVRRMEKQSGVKRRRTGYLDACILQTRWLRFCHVRSAISFWVNVIANKEHKALMSIAPARRRQPAKDSISAQWNGKHWLYRINGQQGTLDHWTDNINNSIVNTLSDSTCDNILHTLLHRHRHRHLFLTSLLAGQDSETVSSASFFTRTVLSGGRVDYVQTQK